MTRDDIIEAARKAGFETKRDMIWVDQWEITPTLTRFAALVAAAEREGCAIAGGAAADAGLDVAAAIRARGQQRPEPTYPSDPIWREQKRLEMEAWARNKLARHGIQIPEDEEYGNPSF
jgi:hypothetical protein